MAWIAMRSREEGGPPALAPGWWEGKGGRGMGRGMAVVGAGHKSALEVVAAQLEAGRTASRWAGRAARRSGDDSPFPPFTPVVPPSVLLLDWFIRYPFPCWFSHTYPRLAFLPSSPQYPPHFMQPVQFSDQLWRNREPFVASAKAAKSTAPTHRSQRCDERGSILRLIPASLLCRCAEMLLEGCLFSARRAQQVLAREEAAMKSFARESVRVEFKSGRWHDLAPSDGDSGRAPSGQRPTSPSPSRAVLEEHILVDHGPINL